MEVALIVLLSIVVLELGAICWRVHSDSPRKFYSPVKQEKTTGPRMVMIYKNGVPYHRTLEGSSDHAEALRTPGLTVEALSD